MYNNIYILGKGKTKYRNIKQIKLSVVLYQEVNKLVENRSQWQEFHQQECGS